MMIDLFAYRWFCKTSKFTFLGSLYMSYAFFYRRIVGEESPESPK